VGGGAWRCIEVAAYDDGVALVAPRRALRKADERQKLFHLGQLVACLLVPVEVRADDIHNSLGCQVPQWLNEGDAVLRRRGENQRSTRPGFRENVPPPKYAATIVLPGAAAEGGVAHATLTLARDLATIGVRVVSVAPETLDSLDDEDEDTLPLWETRSEAFGKLAQSIVENPMINGTVIKMRKGTTAFEHWEAVRAESG